MLNVMLDSSFPNGLYGIEHMMITIKFWGGKKEEVPIRIIRFLLGNINASHFLLMIKSCLSTQAAADSRISQTSV